MTKPTSKFAQLLEAEEIAEQNMRLYFHRFALAKNKLKDNEVKTVKIFNVNILMQEFMVQIFYFSGKTEAFWHTFEQVKKWEKSLEAPDNAK